MPSIVSPSRPRPGTDVRDRILETARGLFYAHGVRAVGVDLVVEQAGVAKTSLYRHFRTKDDLVAAFLEREDIAFWQTWDAVAARHADDARAELFAQVDWLAAQAGTSAYRGCAQINVAAEFPDLGHPARVVATAHKTELRRRLRVLALRIGVTSPDRLAGQLTVLINGAAVSTPIFAPDEAVAMLRHATDALITADTPGLAG
jgi:AcrR family transcriptional regulator